MKNLKIQENFSAFERPIYIACVMFVMKSPKLWANTIKTFCAVRQKNGIWPHSWKSFSKNYLKKTQQDGFILKFHLTQQSSSVVHISCLWG